ncbi:MAG: GGDEF domain-containing protein [Gammaproteobacteria bacterium]
MSKENVLFDKDCPLEAVIQLAEQRDLGALDHTLFDILTRHLPDLRIRLYHLRGQNADDGGKASLDKVLDSDPTMIEKELRLNDEDVQLCIADGNPVLASGGARKPRSIFPILAKTEVSAMVVLSTACSEQHVNFIEPLLRIYASHAFLLNRNEHDSLTGLYNRFALEQKIAQVYKSAQAGKRRCREHQEDICLALIDIDLFKSINDRFGHINGDEVLVHFAREMRRCFRDVDLLFRFGGEEFVIIFRDLSLHTAEFVLQRFRKRIERYKFPQVGKVTASIGYTHLDTRRAPGDIIAQADRALYYAKNNGRNAACCYETLQKSAKLATHADLESNIGNFARASSRS